MIHRFITATAFLGIACAASLVQADLRGLWKFDTADPTAAMLGAPLELTGTSSTVPGVDGSDGAVQLDIGSYYTVTHGLDPIGGDFVNQYTLMMDISYPQASAGKWISLYQTNTGNTNDGDLFIHNGNATGDGNRDRSIGIGAVGYSTDGVIGDPINFTDPDTWYRVVASVDNDFQYQVYVNGSLWLDGAGQGADGRFSLDPFFHIFADENGDDSAINVSNFAIWDTPLDELTIAELGGPSSVGVPLVGIGPLTLTVDAGTGVASIGNNSGEDVRISSYAIRSANGFLQSDDARWNSFSDQSLSSWEESETTAQTLSEQNSAGEYSMDDGQNIPIGTPFSFEPSEFGQRSDKDLSFEYVVPDVGLLTGIVDLKVSEHNTLVLTVDPVSGIGIVENASTFSVDIKGYTIASKSSSLLPSDGNWNSLEDQTEGDWDEANPDTSRLSELNPFGSTTLEAGEQLMLGGLFDMINGEQDLEFEFIRADDEKQFEGVVQYAELNVGLPGDFNNDNTLDRADFSILVGEYGKIGAGLITDLSNDGKVGLSDLSQFRSLIVTAAAASDSVSVVPEPAAYQLMIVMLIGLFVVRCRFEMKKSA